MARDNGGAIELPPQRCPYLLDWFMQSGPAQSGGMGAAPLSAAELAAWAGGHGVVLQPWEFRVLQRASRAYCGELADPGDWPPYGDPDGLYDDDVVADRLAAGLDGLCG